MAVYKRDMVDINLETGNIHRSFLKHSIGYKDAAADHFGIRAYRNGEPVNLTGVSIQGIFMPPQGSPIAITSGNIVNYNEAEVVLPQACYNYNGQFTLAIKLVDPSNAVTGTMRIIDGMVDNTNASGTVAPVAAIPSYQEVLSTYEQAIAAINKTVRFDAVQSLTDTQKATARGNISAPSVADLTAEAATRAAADADLKSALFSVFSNDAESIIGSSSAHKNLNDYTTPGNYKVTSATYAGYVDNGPAASTAYRLLVIQSSATNRIMQIAFLNSTASNVNGKILVRNNAGSGWSAWAELASVKYVDDEISAEASARETADTEIKSAIFSVLSNDAIAIEGTSAEHKDLNDYTTPGNYKVTSATNAGYVDNGPASATAYRLLVIQSSATNRIMQIAFLNSDASKVNGKILVRNNAGSGWSAWADLASSKYVDDEIASLASSVSSAVFTDYAKASVIENGTDLNSVTTPGNYRVVSTENANTIKNMPDPEFTSGFRLIVMTTTISQRIYQVYLASTDNNIYYRAQVAHDPSVVWTEWKKISSEEELKNFGYLPIRWRQGGVITKASGDYQPGDLYNTQYMVRTAYTRIPKSKQIYVAMNPGFVIRCFVYKKVGDDYQLIYIDNDEIEDPELTTIPDIVYYTDTVFKINADDATHFILALKKVGSSVLIVPSDADENVTVSANTDINFRFSDDRNKADLVAEADRVSTLINNHESADTKFKFVGVSDLHYWHKSDLVKQALTDMGNAVRQIAKECDIDYMICLGDYIYRWLLEYKYKDGRCEMISADNILECFNGYPQLRLTGNHDANALELDGNGNLVNYFTMEDLYNRIGKYNTGMVCDSQTGYEKSNYGIVDIAEKKVRIIALNTSDYTDEDHPSIVPREDNAYINSKTAYQMSVRQIKWFINALSMSGISNPNEWKVIIMSHMQIDMLSGQLYDALGANIGGIIIDAFVNKESGTMTVKGKTISYDFTEAPTVDSVMAIVGHSHSYSVENISISAGVRGSVVRVHVPNALPYRTSDAQKSFRDVRNTAFCVFVLDDDVLYAYHYGAGFDRYIHYKSELVNGSTKTLTSQLDNVTWDTSNADIATVSNGTVTKVSAGNVMIYAKAENGDAEYWTLQFES